MVAAADLRQGADQPLQLLRPVPDGQIGQDVADIPELDLDVVLVPEQVVDLDAGQAHVPGVDAELGGVEVEDGVAVDKLPAEGVVPAHGVDLLPGVLRHGAHLAKDLPAAEGQVAAADIQAGHQQIAARGGLSQVDDLPHMPLVDAGADEQEAGLGQAPAALVHGHGGHVRPGFHR